MQKNKIKIITYLFLAIFMLTLAPTIILAQDTGNETKSESVTEEEEQEEEKAEPLDPKKGPLWMAFFFPEGDTAAKLKLYLSIFLKMLLVILIAAAIKVYFLKKHLKIPWKNSEKLAVAAYSETLVEMVFYFLLILFFMPSLPLILTEIAPTAEITEMAVLGKFAVLSLLSMAILWVVGGILTAMLVALVDSNEWGKLKRHFKIGAFLGLIPPVVMLVFLFVCRIVMGWNYL
ncbi:MAG: hypothetical protein GY765_23165 [bacterium]|nr:hypothetical protein [bacterium]